MDAGHVTELGCNVLDPASGSVQVEVSHILTQRKLATLRRGWTRFACSRGTGTLSVSAVTHPRRASGCRDSSMWLSWLLVTAVTRPAVTHQRPILALVPSSVRHLVSCSWGTGTLHVPAWLIRVVVRDCHDSSTWLWPCYRDSKKFQGRV